MLLIVGIIEYKNSKEILIEKKKVKNSIEQNYMKQVYFIDGDVLA